MLTKCQKDATMLPRRFLPLLFLSFISIFGALWYYIGRITQGSMAAVFAIALLATWLAGRAARPTPHTENDEQGGTAVIIAFVAALATWWTALASYAITTSVRSPWTVVPPALLFALGAAVFFSRHLRKPALAVAALLFTGVTLAAVVYPLGYGFDPFLHQAAITHIADTGTLTPKTPYYMGAYALELFLSRPFLLLPLKLVDTYLVSALLALVAMTFAPLLEARHRSASWLFLLLPFSAFITTTPQSIGFVFLLATGLTIITTDGRARQLLTLLFALAALFAHPLAGFFALALAVGIALLRWPALAVITAFGMSALCLPASFLYLQSAASGTLPALTLSFDTLRSIPVPWNVLMAGKPALDLLYVLGSAASILVFALAAVRLARHAKALRLSDAVLAAVMFGAIIAAILMSALPMTDLITYERLDYAGRVVIVVLLLAFPLAALAVPAHRRAATLLLPLLFVGNVYLAYPRDDGYRRDAGFNVQSADFATVAAIDDDAGKTPYVVLSNQATAAAAVRTFGFRTYYHDTIFFYPIPTGGPLYAKFLTMVNDAPSLQTIEETRQLTGAPLVYFVVHDYWWDSNRLNAEAAAIASRSFTPAPGVRVHVFAPRP